MKTRKLVLLAFLLGIGVVLHLIIPGFFFGMKPDMMLVMMFLGLLLYPDKKTAFLLGIGTGILSALTTTFPAGQLPNFIEKVITAYFILAFLTLFKKSSNIYFKVLLITAIGTIVSGSIFLTLAMVFAELPISFLLLLIAVVLPAVLLNTLVMAIVHPIVDKINKRLK
ncbi:tryptophan transporter [Priestia megaterium]|uniref:tryptophan transporter n=1 Tax=Priestia megaterium TaxID=1404 RepID=UPI002E23417B|nr:tryptophan transporter [Priestia megaterium]